MIVVNAVINYLSIFFFLERLFKEGFLVDI